MPQLSTKIVQYSFTSKLFCHKDAYVRIAEVIMSSNMALSDVFSAIFHSVVSLAISHYGYNVYAVRTVEPYGSLTFLSLTAK